MIGAIGETTPDGETIHLGHDPELEDAKWYTFDEVREAMGVSSVGFGDPVPGEQRKLRIPTPQTAIANRLMAAVLDGYLGASPKM